MAQAPGESGYWGPHGRDCPRHRTCSPGWRDPQVKLREKPFSRNMKQA
jgi:hypothetical protein